MKLKYRKLTGYKYQLISKYVLDGLMPFSDMRGGNEFCYIDRGTLYIERGYAWDGPSGPTFDTKNFMRGSLVHDALYQLMREGLLHIKHREYADRLLRDICLEDGMSGWRAWYVYHCVRLFAGKCAKKNDNRGKIVEIELEKWDYG